MKSNLFHTRNTFYTDHNRITSSVPMKGNLLQSNSSINSRSLVALYEGLLLGQLLIVPFFKEKNYKSNDDIFHGNVPLNFLRQDTQNFYIKSN